MRAFSERSAVVSFIHLRLLSPPIAYLGSFSRRSERQHSIVFTVQVQLKLTFAFARSALQALFIPYGPPAASLIRLLLLVFLRRQREGRGKERSVPDERRGKNDEKRTL
jgi:hypothetical protein